MKTNERSGLLRRCAGLSSIGLALSIGACGGATKETPRTSSESHFLVRCGGNCGGGLECIGEICTRPCLTSESNCSDLASGAACTNQSVEPGQVAVCDVGCTLASDCAELGNNYECNEGFCRTLPIGTGGGGTSGSGGGDTSGSGGGGSGGAANCEPYLDQTPPPMVRQVSITNAGQQTVYVERSGGCGDSLVSVVRAGQTVNITGFTCDLYSCQYIVDGVTADCPPAVCPPPVLTPIAPGETVTQIVEREWAVQALPVACVPTADETETDPVTCYSWVIPPPGVYDISVLAFTDPSCTSSTCAPTVLVKQGNWFFEDHTFVLGAPLP